MEAPREIKERAPLSVEENAAIARADLARAMGAALLPAQFFGNVSVPADRTVRAEAFSLGGVLVLAFGAGLTSFVAAGGKDAYLFVKQKITESGEPTARTPQGAGLEARKLGPGKVRLAGRLRDADVDLLVEYRDETELERVLASLRRVLRDAAANAPREGGNPDDPGIDFRGDHRQEAMFESLPGPGGEPEIVVAVYDVRVLGRLNSRLPSYSSDHAGEGLAVEGTIRGRYGRVVGVIAEPRAVASCWYLEITGDVTTAGWRRDRDRYALMRKPSPGSPKPTDGARLLDDP